MTMSSNTLSILKLIATIRVHLQRRAATEDAVGREAAKVLSLLEPPPPLDGRFSGSRHPSTRHLNAALNAGDASTAALLAAVRPIAFDLPWRYSYAKRDDSPGLEDNVSFAEIIGPDAPFKSQQVCLGLTLIGPATLYPSHVHPAIELYYVASGTAAWIANGVTSLHSPGAFILHPSQVVHAMQTRQAPLLAVYSWSGEDVKTPSTYILSEPPWKAVD
jgi:mannose-6-phosphate isomerase-like protein (cupin superfamily)